MRKVRASWLIVLVVASVLLAVPEWRLQMRGQRMAEVIYQKLAAGPASRWRQDPREASRARAAAFAERRYPRDPGLLMAAGLLAPRAEEGLPLLSRAVELSHDPVCFAAYVSRLLEQGPEYTRLGALLVDPADPEQVARAEGQRSSRRAPDRLSPGEAAPILNALHGWEKADPDNGVPHAIEAHCLYGLHRDREAMQAWERAGRLPHARGYSWAAKLARARLLNRMGLARAEATVLSLYSERRWLFEALRAAARYAWYEGRVAQVQGRGEEAMRWWSGTIGLARHLQESGDTKGEFMEGNLLALTGAFPAWQRSANTFYYGPAHGFYAARVGPKADAELRDGLLVAWARVGLLQQTPGPGPLEPDGVITHAMGAQAMAGTTLTLAAWCLGLLVLVSLVWQRAAADAAARRGWVWPALTAAVVVALALAGPLWVLLHPTPLTVRVGGGSVRQDGVDTAFLFVAGSFVAALVLAVGAPLVLSVRGSEGQIELNTEAWGGNLRRALPVMIAVLALACLGLNLVSARLRAGWLETWTKPGTTDLSVEISRIGPKWERPDFGKHGWVAADPPAGGRGGPF